VVCPHNLLRSYYELLLWFMIRGVWKTLFENLLTYIDIGDYRPSFNHSIIWANHPIKLYSITQNNVKFLHRMK